MEGTIRARIQAFGGFLTGMVIPNMGAFIAWGFITALFIPTGWFPNEDLGQLVGPMINYVLPLLLAYTGGRMVGDVRGGVAGVVGTFGLIIGAGIPMFLGAMIMGPLSAWIVKQFDKLISHRIPAGFEMVINNFSLGIIGMLLCIASYKVVGPMVEGINVGLERLIDALVSTGFLPILSVFNEPAKVLFLNNVIDQGIYYPLGMQQASDINVGKSIYFMVASNPGTGLGLLLAYWLFGKGVAKETSPGAIIIHFFGGIHEIYYPFVFMKPATIIAMIMGGATGTFIFDLFGVGLVAGPSPGSIFAYLALTPKGNFLGVIAGVFGACAMSFFITSLILKASKKADDGDFGASQQKTKAMKAEGKSVLTGEQKASAGNVSLIVFACDAGMGSSAMGANTLGKKLKQAGLEIEVQHAAIEKVPENADLIVTHANLADRVKLAFPNKRLVTITSYLKDPKLEELIQELSNAQ